MDEDNQQKSNTNKNSNKNEIFCLKDNDFFSKEDIFENDLSKKLLDNNKDTIERQYLENLSSKENIDRVKYLTVNNINDLIYEDKKIKMDKTNVENMKKADLEVNKNLHHFNSEESNTNHIIQINENYIDNKKYNKKLDIHNNIENDYDTNRINKINQTDIKIVSELIITNNKSNNQSLFKKPKNIKVNKINRNVDNIEDLEIKMDQKDKYSTVTNSDEIDVINLLNNKRKKVGENTNVEYQNDTYLQEIKKTLENNDELNTELVLSQDIKKDEFLENKNKSFKLKAGIASVLNNDFNLKYMKDGKKYDDKEIINTFTTENISFTNNNLSNSISEILVGKGVSNALEILKSRGYLNDNFFDSNDNKDNNLSNDLNVNIEYRDKTGRLLTTKEAGKYLSRVFQGKHKGVNKTEKEMLKHSIEDKRHSTINETNKSLMMTLLRKHQAKNNTVGMVLK